MSPSLFNGWTSWDDHVYVLNNQLIQHFSWEKLKAVFTTAHVNGTYSPLVLLSWALNHNLHGTSPFGYHFLNLALHVLNTLLVFVLVRKLSDNASIAFGTALLFSIHPMNVEPVAWITGRKDVLYAFFTLTSLVLYTENVRTNSRKPFLFIASLLVFLLALLSKATAVILPILIVLTDILFNRQPNKKMVLEKLPFFGLAVLFGGLAFYAQSQTAALSEMHSASLIDSILAVGHSQLIYILKVVAPFKLSAFHPYPNSLLSVTSIIGIVIWLLALIGGGLLFKRNGTSLIGFGILFFLTSIFPVSQIIPVGPAIVADRYAYVPYVGIFISLSAFVEFLVKKTSKMQVFVYPVCCCFILFLGLCSFNQAKTWKSDQTLWSNVIAHYPNCAKGYVNRGMYYTKMDDSKAALADFQKALNIEPTMVELHQQMGLLNQRLGQYHNAQEAFNKAIELNPFYEPARLNNALNYVYLNNRKMAISELTKLSDISPDYLLTYLNRGVLYEQYGAMTLALADYSKATELAPLDHRGFQYRAVLYYRIEAYGEALHDAARWVELKPTDPNAQKWLDKIRATTNGLEK